MEATEVPLVQLVHLEIKPECLEEFKKIIAIDVECARKEPGVHRFDLLTD